MKKHISKFSVIILTAVFGYGGFYYGSKEKRIELIIPRPITEEAHAAPEEPVLSLVPTTSVKEAALPKKTAASAAKPKTVVKKKPAPKISAPAPEPAAVVAEEPRPTTKVS